eukprot:GHVS01022889.1.p1 GENE.GHVS01022889.1~~GHVS01022889.1.p1  ORF type:complete len:477 (+),score=53.35 GHVS01022889.1:78-1508(+)
MLGMLRKAAGSTSLQRGVGSKVAAAEIPYHAWNQPPTKVTTLSNGVRVATQATPDETATVGVWIDSGSRYETKETNGAAHFLEHMAFKGTKRRTRVQLEKEIEDMGAHLNAYTAREQTVYYAKAFKKDVPQAMDILSDILIHSVYDERSIDNERPVILREMEEVEKATEEVVFDRLHMTAFRDSPLGFTILGPVENIQTISKKHLVDYVKRNYTADRMVIAAAGAVDHKQLVSMAEEQFGKVPPPPTNIIRPPEEKPFFCGSELIHRNDEGGPIAHVAVAFEGVPWKSPDAIPFMLMQSIIGSYKKHDEGLVPGKISGNRTVNNIANRMGVGACEMFSAFNTCYKDTGLFGFYCQADETAVDTCVTDLMFGITSLSYSVTDEEVQMAKLQLKTLMLGNMDSTTAIAEDIGRQLLVYGRRMSIPEFLKRLDVIDAEEIKRLAWKYFHDRDVAVTALGPLHGMPQYADLRRHTYWLRY